MGNFSERIKNILNFKKPAAWIMVVSIIIVAALVIGFILNRLSASDPTVREAQKFAGHVTELTLDNVRSLAKKGDALKFNDFNKFKGVDLSSNTNYHIMLYKVEGGYRLIVRTDGKKIDNTSLERVWDGNGSGIDIRYDDVDEFIDSHPSPGDLVIWRDTLTSWQDIEVGMSQDEVHRIMGEPGGMLSGLYGEIYKLDDGSGVVIYYDSESKVNHIKLTELQVETTSPAPTKIPTEDMELIASADLDRDGCDELIYLDKTQIESTHDITLRIIDSDGIGIWSESANTSHAGWNSLFLFKQDGEYFLLRYNPTMYQGYGTYVYTLFTLEGGKEKVYRTNTLEFDLNGTEELDVPKMVSYADEVNALLEKSILLMSTKDGTYSFGPSAEPFYERYSWLDLMPELYEVGDDLETRLKKYSDYLISKQKLNDGEHSLD